MTGNIFARSSARVLIAFFVLLLTLAVTIGCEKTKSGVSNVSPVVGGAYLASIDVTGKDPGGNLQTTTVDDYPIWIMQDGAGVSYWGALGLAMEDKVVIDSKIENVWTGIDGLYVTSVYKGSAVETTAKLSVFTTYFAGDGSVLAGPVRTDFKFYNLTGPITLPVSTPTPSTIMEAPTLPVHDLTVEGMRGIHANYAPGSK